MLALPLWGACAAPRKGVSLKFDVLKSVRVLLPPALGFLGGVVAVVYPSYHVAFCSGAFNVLP